MSQTSFALYTDDNKHVPLRSQLMRKICREGHLATTLHGGCLRCDAAAKYLMDHCSGKPGDCVAVRQHQTKGLWLPCTPRPLTSCYRPDAFASPSPPAVAPIATKPDQSHHSCLPGFARQKQYLQSKLPTAGIRVCVALLRSDRHILQIDSRSIKA